MIWARGDLNNRTAAARLLPPPWLALAQRREGNDSAISIELGTFYNARKLRRQRLFQNIGFLQATLQHSES